MGKAGQALKQTLELHDISQNRLAIALSVDRSIVSRWFHEKIDPAGETIHQITTALQSLDLDAADSFVNFYLGNFTKQSSLDIASQNSPKSPQVAVNILLQLFGKKATSYKYLFFISLLNILKQNNYDVSLSISFKDIVIEMLANAWFPHVYFQLSFGIQDKIAEKLDSLNITVSEPVLKFQDPKRMSEKGMARKKLEH